MFGSLVIVFPTSHQGGALKLRHRGEEWTFDSGKELASQNTPSIGYAAFFSDIEHEVIPVESGYRITVTYNLYFSNNPSSNIIRNPSVAETSFQEALSVLVVNPNVLPQGGNLGFGLRHEYPVNEETDLSNLISCLKVCRSSPTSFYAMYSHHLQGKRRGDCHLPESANNCR